jgi:hypothetical protein
VVTKVLWCFNVKDVSIHLGPTRKERQKEYPFREGHPVIINEKTPIPIGVAIALIGGGAVWLTTIALQTNANAKYIELIEQRQLKYNESIQSIERDIAIIKVKSELIERRSRGR